MRPEAERAGRPLGFKPHLRLEVVPGEATYLLSAQGVTAIQGRYVEKLAPLLDGTRTLERLLAEAEPQVPAAAAGRLIADLARANLVGYRVPAVDDAAQAYWELAGVDGGEAEAALGRLPVAVVATGRIDAEQARRVCSASGLAVRDPSDTAPAALTLVLCDDYLDPRLRAIDAGLRSAGRPWLLAKPGGAQPWIGPVFQPGGACWSCLAHRLRGQRRSEVPLQRALGITGPVPRPEASLAASRAMGLQAAVLASARWLAGVRDMGEDGICIMDTLAMKTRHHSVRRRPQCGDCGDPGLSAARVLAPVEPVSRPKVPGTESGDRALTPEQMLRRYRHLVSPVTGIVDAVRPDNRLPDGVNCYVSGRNLAMEPRTLAGLRSGLRSSSGGKGTTPLEAEVGALCEAAERYCATRQGDEPVVRDTLRGLGSQALHPNDCQLFDERQFRARERWNATHSAFHQVPAPFDPDRPVDWTPVWSLTAGTHRLLPTSMLYYGEDPLGPWADSNGNAAGSSLEDAIVQGFLEVVERDAVALWWYNRTRHPAVDLDAFDEPWITRLRTVYAGMNREVWAVDLSSDFGIPVMAAVSRRTDKAAEDLAFGFGAHFDPRIALRRALTEMGQLLPAVCESRADGSGYRLRDPELMSWWTGATVRNQPYLTADPGESARCPADYGYRARTDLREDIAAAERMVRARGMELLVLDQTRPDIELPVVRVIVPGMRHFWARFGPGRLFETPVRLGRIARPTAFEDLNPIPLFV
ncbi:TOMM precursor leader peptide-binding protein [Peterkaempfera griseoplana]|uniref:TOMM precursor leader peptide-binding protein n=1 Tax=Peterkaempfera griseoplana TaxID=66896 RepID=UPI0006E2620C|nr:TOMM precursor leader peptide-binding protein [Peterkaempfera griseoplana]